MQQTISHYFNIKNITININTLNCSGNPIAPCEGYESSDTLETSEQSEMPEQSETPEQLRTLKGGGIIRIPKDPAIRNTDKDKPINVNPFEKTDNSEVFKNIQNPVEKEFFDLVKKSKCCKLTEKDLVSKNNTREYTDDNKLDEFSNEIENTDQE